jgi:hypothetical protein
MKAFIDRDYLSDEEIESLKEVYPFLHFTPYYNIETVYYHPDNLEEYYNRQGKSFDKEAYINEITKELNDKLAYISAGVAKARDGYPFFKENKYDTYLKAFRGNIHAIIDMLRSTEFDTFYKVFNAKDYGKSIVARQNLNPNELTKTHWFKSTIQKALQ